MKPIVLCFSGHDPSGGAGIQADIEAIGNNNAQAKCIITAITIQNTKSLIKFIAVSPELVRQQAQMILEEFTPKVIKLGMLASGEIALEVLGIINSLSGIKVVLDPVLKTGNNQPLASTNLLNTMQELLPKTTLITPNQNELNNLGGIDDLFNKGVQNILLTTSDSTKSKNISHYWYNQQQIQEFKFARLPHKYHGSGCTLASSISANLANGHDINTALNNGLNYTWQTLKNAEITKTWQLTPNRFFNV